MTPPRAPLRLVSVSIAATESARRIRAEIAAVCGVRR
jgi:hypothetical protein